MGKTKKIHFVGIKGVGMTPLAVIAKEAGFIVSGCDTEEKFITDVLLEKSGIKAMRGFDKSHIEDSDLVITTGAHGGFDNVEVISAKQLGIPVWTQGEAVGKFMEGEILGRNFDGISVAGSHGKTTTTAMISAILKENRLDPSFVIGTGEIPFLESSGHFGKGKYFVAEADEYSTEPKYDKKPKFLWQKTNIGVITSIEFDHPDLYNSLEDLRKAFLNFANHIEPGGSLVVCADYPQTVKLINDYRGRKITYGFFPRSDFRLKKISIEQDRMFLWVNARESSLGEFSLNVTGEHNALNALCSIIVCLELGLSVENIRKGLIAFKGTKRRFEYLGKLPSGALLYDDYAHHPTEIKNTLSAVKSTYPNKKIVCIFQPHTYSRTKSLLEQFIRSFSLADIIVLVDIFPSAREKADDSVSSKLLSNEISKFHKDVLYIPELADVVKYVGQKAFDKNYIVISMGAGNIYKIDEELIK